MMKTAEAAQGKWRGVLEFLGVEPRVLSGKHHPCPVCGGNDRFRFDDKEGKGTYYCNQCGPGDGMKLAMAVTGLDFKACAARIDSVIGNIKAKPAPPKSDPLPRLKRIAKVAQAIDGTGTEKYLRARGCPLPTAGVWHVENSQYWDGEKTHAIPAMAALISDADGVARTYHMTYLGDGRKADVDTTRKIMPATGDWQGGAVRLFEPAYEMGIAEGIETALSASKLFKMPVWAAINSGNLSKFVPPPECGLLTVFGDCDNNYTGQAAAYALANRVSIAGMACRVEIPKTLGDWNDE